MPNTSVLKVSRLTSLTDGVFATAMTILVFSVHLPDGTNINNLSAILFTNVAETIYIYFGSFIILGTQWIIITFQHGFLCRLNRAYIWLNIFYLIAAGVVPFSTSVVIDYPRSPNGIEFFVVNLMFSSIMQTLLWQCGSYFKLYTAAAYTPFIRKAIIVRLSIPPVFYISALIVAQWNTTIAFAILIMQPLFHMIPGKVDKYVKERELGL